MIQPGVTLPSRGAATPKVLKIPGFRGSLAARPLYIYLPPGYHDHPERHYPVIYLHDGQNCFEAYARDSYTGSTWRADETADELILAGKMRAAVIVGVGHGGKRRIAEYLPDYITFLPEFRPPHKFGFNGLVQGRAERTAHYYRRDVAGFIAKNFRVLTSREDTATIGSSMGGLFATYLAWEHPEFARHHAILSPSYWITRNQEGSLEIIDRIQAAHRPDVRLWLSHGQFDRPGEGDDNGDVTRAGRDALLEKGFVEGEDFRYYYDEGAIHEEKAWARILPQILEFIFPAA
jgi:predicted alpha/beta superfamily hydrolase